MTRMGVAIAVAIAVMLSGCSAADPDSARATVAAWDPGPGYTATDCASLGYVETNMPDACWTFDETSHLDATTAGLADDLAAAVDADTPAAPQCEVNAGRLLGCASMVRISGVDVLVYGELALRVIDREELDTVWDPTTTVTHLVAVTVDPA